MSNSINEKIDILFFTSSLGGGGAEKHLVRLANGLDKNKFEVIVVLSRKGGIYESELDSHIRIVHLNNNNIKSSTLNLLLSIRKLSNFCKQDSPDIICSFMDHANFVTALATKNLSIKTILGVQVSVLSQFKGIRKLIFYYLIKFLYPLSDKIVAISKGVAQEIIQINSALDEKISVIYNIGVDQYVLEGAKKELADNLIKKDKSVILTCGRLTEQKGLGYLLDAFSEMKNFNSNELWVLGDGPLKDDLIKQAKKLGIKDHVKFLGFKNNPYKYMAVADLFVLSSLWEGFGNVIVEAMASGAPVIATDCAHGPGEIITNLENGLLVPPGDSNALTKAMEKLLSDKELRNRLVKKGKERANDYNTASIVKEYESLFQNV